jgi:N-acetyl sugar amidotransferase
MGKEYQRCTRCVMDTSAIDITFNKEGICNYCTEFLARYRPMQQKSADQMEKELNEFINKIKTTGKGKRYDCIIGLSGGVDSSWALVQAVQCGLRPLAVHMDNGWNSELAQNNIANLVRALNVDLYTHVIDWPEYKGLMQAFFDADVIDVELLYDNAMLGVNYKLAAKYGIKYILAGTNQATEGMALPKKWNWFKFDKKNIKMISQKMGGPKLTTFPAFSTIDYVRFEFIKKIRWISFLDFFEYNKNEVLDTLEKDYGYHRYPFKHYESIFTRFYQGYILPTKFGVDKRLLHLGTLVASGQMAREEALNLLQTPAFISEQLLKEDTQYFLKKMGWTEKQFSDYLSRPEKPHDLYGSEKGLWDWFFKDGDERKVYRMLVNLYRSLKRSGE